MSIVTLQIGQCGNQIGGQFFSTIVEDLQLQKSADQGKPNETGDPPNDSYGDECLHRFFSVSRDEAWTARSVLVDMEPKAIAQTVADARRSGCWSYSTGNQLCQKRGSGNNWAHGFCRHGPAIEKRFMDMVQREAEKCDRLDGFLVLMSLAGGTGSGVGAYLTRCLRDQFPHSAIVNQVGTEMFTA